MPSSSISDLAITLTTMDHPEQEHDEEIAAYRRDGARDLRTALG